jgi:hypothetical protein
MCWHFDHTVGKSVRGINMLNALYYRNNVSIPIAFEIIKKPIEFSSLKTKQRKRKSEITKNELMRDMIQVAINNQVKFRYVLMDTWFSSKENFEFIVKKKKEFVAALKSNRLFAKSLEDKLQGKFVRVDELELLDKQSIYNKMYPKYNNKYLTDYLENLSNEAPKIERPTLKIVEQCKKFGVYIDDCGCLTKEVQVKIPNKYYDLKLHMYEYYDLFKLVTELEKYGYIEASSNVKAIRISDILKKLGIKHNILNKNYSDWYIEKEYPIHKNVVAEKEQPRKKSWIVKLFS